MAVTVQTPFVTHTGNGSTKIFAYTYLVLALGDLKVYVNGVLQTSGYTVSGIGLTGGGNVTFTTAPANGAAILFNRETDLSRSTDYVDGGALVADTLDVDLDRAVMMIQEIDAYAIKADVVGEIDFTNNTLVNVPTPVDGGDAANKTYVDAGDAAQQTYTDNLVNSLTTIIDFAVQYSQITAIDGTFTILESAPLVYKINSATFRTASGTVTAQLLIDGVPVTNMSAMGMTSVQQTVTTTTNNTVGIGSRVQVVLSSNVNAEGLSITFACSKQIT